MNESTIHIPLKNSSLEQMICYFHSLTAFNQLLVIAQEMMKSQSAESFATNIFLNG